MAVRRFFIVESPLLTVWVRKKQPLQGAASFKALPLVLGLCQPVGQGPPYAGVKAETYMAGENFHILGEGMAQAGLLNAGAPGDHTIGSGKNRGRPHWWGCGQVKMCCDAGDIVPAGQFVQTPRVGAFVRAHGPTNAD